MRVRNIRRAVQLIILAFFVWLLFATRWQPAGPAPTSPWFLRLDPLAMLMSALSPMHAFLPYFLPALVLIALTVAFGRFFCGWICPLGTTIDICETIALRKHHRGARPQANRPALKYYILIGVLVSAIFGTQIGWLLDPIPLLTRTAATVFWPIGEQLYNLLAIYGRPVLRPVGISLYPGDVHEYLLSIPVALFFAAVVGLSYMSRRYWCRTLCPLGGLLGLIGRWGLWRRHTEACTSCKRCLTGCKMGAIPQEDPDETRSAECILCYNCVVCPMKPPAVAIDLSMKNDNHLTATGAARRRFLAAAGIGLAYGAVVSTGVSRRPRTDRLLRPPGAIKRVAGGSFERLSEEEFRSTCVRCGNCMKVCVTGGLQPALLEAGWDAMYTPVLVPTIGWCEQECNACGEICPSGALQPFTVKEKNNIRIGRAYVDHNKCLSWREGNLYKLCLVCKEQCPYLAVDTLIITGRKRPAVDDDKCVGCGQCENKCPITPVRAIRVQRKGPLV